MVSGWESWRFGSGQGNHEKRSISFDFPKTSYTIWFTYNWEKNSPFNDQKHSSKLCQITLSQKRKEQNSGHYNLAISIFWPLSHWISLGGIGLKFEENTQKVRVSFFSAWRILGTVCHFFFKSLERMQRICKTVIKAWCCCMISFIDKWLIFCQNKSKYNVFTEFFSFTLKKLYMYICVYICIYIISHAIWYHNRVSRNSIVRIALNFTL